MLKNYIIFFSDTSCLPLFFHILCFSSKERRYLKDIPRCHYATDIDRFCNVSSGSFLKISAGWHSLYTSDITPTWGPQVVKSSDHKHINIRNYRP